MGMSREGRAEGKLYARELYSRRGTYSTGAARTLKRRLGEVTRSSVEGMTPSSVGGVCDLVGDVEDVCVCVCVCVCGCVCVCVCVSCVCRVCVCVCLCVSCVCVTWSATSKTVDVSATSRHVVPPSRDRKVRASW